MVTTVTLSVLRFCVTKSAFPVWAFLEAGAGGGGAVLSTFCLLPNDLVVNAMRACSVCLPRGWEDSPALGVDFVY